MSVLSNGLYTHGQGVKRRGHGCCERKGTRSGGLPAPHGAARGHGARGPGRLADAAPVLRREDVAVGDDWDGHGADHLRDPVPVRRVARALEDVPAGTN